MRIQHVYHINVDIHIQATRNDIHNYQCERIAQTRNKKHNWNVLKIVSLFSARCISQHAAISISNERQYIAAALNDHYLRATRPKRQ